MTVHFYCRCGYLSDAQWPDEPVYDHEPLDGGCCNCGGQKCMDCAGRMVHDRCINDCPDCCRESAAAPSGASLSVGGL